MAGSISNPGNAQAIFQLGIKLDSSKVQEFDVSSNAEHSTSTVQETVGFPVTTQTVVLTYDSSYVNRLLETVMVSANPDVMVRFGLGTPGSFFWLPWQNHVITSFSAVPQSIGNRDGFQVKIVTGDVLAKISRASTHTVARKGTVSDIVKKIAEENGLKKTVIEPTVGKVSLIQSYESDYNFARERLVPRAVNAKGRGNYRLYVKDNALHFHTLDYQAEIRDLDYYVRSSAFQLIQTDRSQEMLRVGAAAGVIAILYDPLTGEIRSVASKPEGVLKMGNTAPDFSTVPGGELNLLMHVGQNLGTECENIAQSRFEHDHSQMFELMLMTTKTPTLRLNDILSINLNPNPSKTSPWTGFYSTFSAKHIISKGDLTSSFILQRGELNTNQGDFSALQGYDKKAIPGTFDAPGQGLNVKEVESSAITRGPETSRFRTVLNPETD